MSTNSPDQVTLIIGATGFAGGALAAALRGEGRAVRAMVRASSDVADLQRLGVELVEGDITDAAAVGRAVKGAGVVYNFASPFRSAKATRQTFERVNVDGVRHLIDAAERHGTGRVVHCSTIGVHGHVKEVPCREDSPYNPGDDYQETKLEAELLFRGAVAGGLPGVVMRPASMYGPGDTRMLKLFRLVQAGRWRTVGDGSAWFHACYRDDLVTGFRLCGEHPAAAGGVFILPGREPARLGELVNKVADAVGVKHPTKRLPLGPMLFAARWCERVCKPLGIDPPLHERRVRFFTNDRYFDGTRARTTLGYEPAVGLDEGLRTTADWYFARGLLPGASPRNALLPSVPSKAAA